MRTRLLENKGVIKEAKLLACKLKSATRIFAMRNHFLKRKKVGKMSARMLFSRLFGEKKKYFFNLFSALRRGSFGKSQDFVKTM